MLFRSPTINSLAHLSKLFNQLNNTFYKKKLKDDYIDPVNEIYNNYMYDTNILIFYMETDLITFNMIRDSMINVTSLINQFFIDNLWISLVNDLELMQNIFYHLCFLNRSYNYYKSTMFFRFLFEEQIYKDVLNAFDDIKQFLYIEYPNSFNVTELRQLARFKNVRKVNKRNRSQLIHSLRRPNDEIYILPFQKSYVKLTCS